MSPRGTRGAWLVVGLACLASPAHAQMGMDPYGGGMMPMGGPSQPPGKKKPAPKKPSDEPETHAAPGAGDAVLGSGNEPTLPDDPLTIPPSVAEKIGSNLALEEQELGRKPETLRRFYGVYYSEQSGGYGYQMTLPPLWVHREQPSRTRPEVRDDASLYGLFYYHRRSAERADDVLFPLFYNWRDRVARSRTTVVGPFVDRKTPDESDRWLAPLWFRGHRKDGGYTLVPPLLYYDHRDAEGGFNLVGPGFCSFRGGRHCDTRTAEDIDLGLVPFYFFGQNRDHLYELIPPLVHYYSYNDRDLSYVNIWGPYYRSHTQKRDLLHVLPMYWSLWRPNGGRHTTVFPFYHWGHEGNAWLFANPLFLLANAEDGARTFVTWGYARHRGRTSLDMITPFYWHYQDPDIHLDQHLLFPFLYSRTSPRESTQAFFPFWAHSERYSISETTWITPFFQHTHDLTGWTTNIHPILYLGRDAKQSHTVVAPVFFDFAGTESRATVAFPFYWRFSDLSSVTQLVGNVYYGEKKLTRGLDWQVHIFPLFSYGESPGGHFWNVLFGLAGYTRDGENTKARVLWIPIPLSRSASEAEP